MTPLILAVALLDPSLGVDQFFVQTGDDEVVVYEATRSGAVHAITDPAPLVHVTASIEKFNHGYRCETPVPLASIGELPRYVGRFETVNDTRCRLTA